MNLSDISYFYENHPNPSPWVAPWKCEIISLDIGVNGCNFSTFTHESEKSVANSQPTLDEYDVAYLSVSIHD